MRRQVTAVLAVAALSIGGSVVADRSGLTTGSAATAQGRGVTAADERGGRYITNIRLYDGRSVGTVRFLRDPVGTRVTVSLRMPADLAAAGGTFHGFHVHANSDPANGTGCVADPDRPSSTWFVSADGHYSDPAADHGQHTGDMPVVYLQEGGRSTASFVTDRFEPEDVVGRAVIVHALPDNYGNIPLGGAPTAYTPNGDAALDLTERTGNASDRIACGVVRR